MSSLHQVVVYKSKGYMPKIYWEQKVNRVKNPGSPDIQFHLNLGQKPRTMPEIGPDADFVAKRLDELGENDVFKLALNSSDFWKLDVESSSAQSGWVLVNTSTQETMEVVYPSNKVYCFNHKQ